ncbi:MAG TPA: heme NO-binding domain-containing protein [Rhizobacter sp.]|nr:heme NO-binding domain-containing protein [Rhizobacter sp.]
MYGLVNQAIEDFVVHKFGHEAWQRVRDASGVCPDMFIAMDSYPDEVTAKLVETASGQLGMDSEQILRGFGEYWVLYTAQAGYGDMMAMFGSDLSSFLANLDTLHSHVAMTFPGLRPPSFTVEPLDGGLRLHYRSERAGMAPMVMGLLQGLARRFSQNISVEQTAHKGRQDHDVFEVRFV